MGKKKIQDTYMYMYTGSRRWVPNNAFISPKKADLALGTVAEAANLTVYIVHFTNSIWKSRETQWFTDVICYLWNTLQRSRSNLGNTVITSHGTVTTYCCYGALELLDQGQQNIFTCTHISSLNRGYRPIYVYIPQKGEKSAKTE